MKLKSTANEFVIYVIKKHFRREFYHNVAIRTDFVITYCQLSNIMSSLGRENATRIKPSVHIHVYKIYTAITCRVYTNIQS